MRYIIILLLFCNVAFAQAPVWEGEYIVRAQGRWCPLENNPNQICPDAGYAPGTYLVTVDKDGNPAIGAESKKDRKLVYKYEDHCKKLAGPGKTCSPNYFVRKYNIPDDREWPKLWGMADIGAPKAWDKTQGDAALIAVVIDTGVTYEHSELTGKIHPESKSVIDNSAGADDNGHGSHVSGTICANSNNGNGVSGVNWNCTILSLKFLTASGGGSMLHAVRAVDEVTRLKKQGLNIVAINASWGSRGESLPLKEAIRDAGDNQILFIAAAGNDGVNNDSIPHFPSSFDLPNIVSVAALQKNQVLASFSNYGKNTVDLAAPGANILSLGHRGETYVSLNGTSMAAPHVTGAALLLKAANPELDMMGLKERLFATVVQSGALKKKVSTGGKLDLAGALGASCDDTKLKKCFKCCGTTYQKGTKSRGYCRRCCRLKNGCVKGE